MKLAIKSSKEELETSMAAFARVESILGHTDTFKLPRAYGDQTRQATLLEGLRCGKATFQDGEPDTNIFSGKLSDPRLTKLLICNYHQGVIQAELIFARQREPICSALATVIHSALPISSSPHISSWLALRSKSNTGCRLLKKGRSSARMRRPNLDTAHSLRV